MLRNLGIIGATQVGKALTLGAAQAGVRVTLIEKLSHSFNGVEMEIKNQLEKTARKLYLPILSFQDLQAEDSFIEDCCKLVKISTNLEETKFTDLTIDVTEDHLKEKQQLAHQLDKICPINTILGTHTESLTINDIARKVDKKSRFVGIHFPQLIETTCVAEIVFLEGASERARIVVSQFCRLMNMTEFECEDQPGFVVNRLLASLATEAEQMTKERQLSEEKLENALKRATGMKMGPFQFLERMGKEKIERIMNKKD